MLTVSNLPTLLLLLLATPLWASGSFTEQADAFFKRYISEGRVDYDEVQSDGAAGPLVERIATTDLSALTGDERKAFLINAYNLLVIDQAVAHYPLASVLDQAGFFDGNKYTVAGRRLTLNQLEKNLLLREFPDPRLHFVLVCGAVDCPPITDFAYTAEQLDAQLERQTRLALNEATFIRVRGDEVELSQIFQWYQRDFGGSEAAVIAYIDGYRATQLPAGASVSYYTYDWSINATASTAIGGNNAARYVVSSTILRGTFEFKLFNNRYTQQASGERATFFTATLNALYGLSDRVNVGLAGRYRTVSYTRDMDMPMSRSGLTGIGPQVRIAPFRRLPNFSIQSSLTFATGDDLTGALGTQRFIDWDGPVSFTQIFNDFPIGNYFSLFAELDLLIEDIGSAEDGRSNRTSTPVTGIFSYFPTPRATLYGLASYSPFWQQQFDYFYQLGGGAKYQFTPKFELEVLVTAFQNNFLSSVGGTASTLNLGLRFNL
jgi:hypothetical protein